MRLSFSDMLVLGCRTRSRSRGRSRRRKLRRLALLQQLEPRQLLAADSNQAPSVTGGSFELEPAQIHVVLELDLGYSDPDGDPMSHLTIEALPAIGSLELYDYPVYPGQWIDASELSYGYLVYVPDSGVSANYTSSFSFTANDGSDDSSPALVTFNVSVSPNSPPAVTGSVHTLAANQTHTLTPADLGYTDADGDPLQSITILSLPSTGTLEYYGCPVYSGETFSYYEIAYGYLAYHPDPYAGSSHSDSFSFTASDGQDTSSAAQVAFNITVAPNSPPTASGSAHSLAADQTHTLTLANLGYSDADGDSLQSITILSPPSTGTLEYYGYPIYGGETLNAYEIAYGYLTYHPDPYAGSSHSDSFSFTASDGRDNSSAATIYFHVTLGENTPPTTADTSISVPEDGYVMLGSAHFPFADADGDSFSHITILSLPSNATLTYYGYPVSLGQTIDAYELDYDSLELTFSPDSGNAVAAISFSVSDGTDSSAPATLTAILESSANQRPVTAPIQLDLISGETLWFGPATFPYNDPDGDPLHHVTIHAVPSGADLIDRDGNSLPLPTEITAQMLLNGEVGFHSETAETELALVFTVSDGNLESAHSVLTITMIAPGSSPAVDEPPLRIDLSDWTGPVITLADGFIPGADAVPSSVTVAHWLDADGNAGVLEFQENDQWTYTETFDAGPSGEFDSLAYVFIAGGVGSTVHSYTVNITGAAAAPDEGSSPENRTPPDPPIPEAPLPNDQPNSLSYHLSVTLDGDGNISDHTISGHYHSSYYFAFVDVPYGDQPAPEGGEGDEQGNDPFGSTGTFTIILMSWTTLSFDSLGTGIDVGDQAYFSYSGGGSYQYDPLATASIVENDEENGSDDGGGEASSDGEGEPAGGDSSAATGLVSGTFTESGLHTSTITASGRIRRDGTPDSLTLTDSWFDQMTFAYEGNGTYTAGETTGTIVENGSDTFIDDGSITLVLHPDSFEFSGYNTLTALGHSFYCDSWETPIDSDEDGVTLLGNAWGSITLQDSYYDHFEFEMRPVQADGPDDPQEPGGDDPESGGEGDETAPTHRWHFVTGSFNDFVNVVDEGGYEASGSYSTTAGVGPGRGSETSALDSPLSGTIEIGGTYKSSITYDASGTITPDEVSFDTGSLNLSDASDSFSTISTSGPVNTGGLSGVITFKDHHETDYLRDLTFDLTDPDVRATGHGHDYVLTDTRFDQSATGTIGFDDMSGSQWANLKNYHFLEISVDYVWSNGPTVDDSGGGGGAIGGWVTKSTELTLIADADFDIGYNVSGLVTRDGLSGQAGEHAYQRGFNVTHLVVVSKQDADPRFSFTTIHSSDDFFSAFHELSGGYTSEPIAPSGVIISGQAWENARSESETASFSSFSVELDQEPERFGIFTIRDEDFFASGHSGAAVYSRTDGDTAFTGSAMHEESFLSDNRLFVIYSLDDEGSWRLGPPVDPLADYLPSRSSSRLEIKYNHSYQGSGAIDGSRGSVTWNSAQSQASESGHSKYSMTLETFGEPGQAPPPQTQDVTGGGGDSDDDDDDGTSGGEGSDQEEGGQATASTLPALVWTYTGTLETDSSFLSQFERTAVGVYDSGTLSGSISEFFSFTSRAGHDDFSELAADGQWLQSVGEIRASTQGEFLFDLDLSGEIGADNPHSGGMTGSIMVRNHAGGDFDFEQTDTFSPALSGTAAGGSWSSDGKQGHSSRYHSLVSVDLSGTIHSAIGGASTSVQLSFETRSHSAGYAVDRFTLDTVSTADEGPTDDQDAWLQTIGASGSRNVSRSQSTKLATGETSFTDETMKSRNETTTWQRLLSPGGVWAEGGRATEDYDFSLLQGSAETKQLSIPMGQGGGMLTGESYQNSSQEMTVKTRHGVTFGDGGDPPPIDPGEGDLNALISLPPAPQQAGTSAGPDADDPDAQGDWHSGNYGRMIVSNFGEDSAGFSLEGSYSVNAGGVQPATAMQSISSNSSSGYKFELKSKLDSATGQWKNTSGSRSTSNSSDDYNASIVSGSWASGSGGFTVSGEFLDSTIHSNSSSSGTAGELNPTTGEWSSSHSSGFSQFSKIDRVSSGNGSYSHWSYGFPVSGSITVNSEYHSTSDHSLLNIMVNGARSSESTGSGYSEHSTRSMVHLTGGGEDRRTVTDSGPLLNADGDSIGSYTHKTTYDHVVIENSLHDYRSSDHTDYRYDVASGTLVPSQRTVVNSHTIDVSLDHIHDLLSDNELETAHTIGDRQHDSTGNFFSRTRLQQTSGQGSARTTTATTPLEGPAAGITSVIVSGSPDESYTTVDSLYKVNSNYRYEVVGPGYHLLETAAGDARWTSFDAVVTTSQTDGTGTTRYAGNRGISGSGGTETRKETIDDEVVDDESYEMPLEQDDGRPDSYETVHHSDEESPTEIPEPYVQPQGPPPPTPPALGPGGVSAPDLPAGVSELQSEVETAGASASEANAARDEYFTDLATGSEQLNENDGESETNGDPQTPASLGSGYANISSTRSPAFATPNFDQLIADPKPEIAIYFPNASDGDGSAYMLINAPTESTSLGQRFVGWFSDWFNGLIGASTAEERAQLNHDALQGNRPDLIRGEGFTPETLEQMGQAQIGQSRFLDGKHIRGSITANEVGIGAINYLEASMQELVIAALGAKAAELGLQAGGWALTRTSAGKWAINQGGKLIELSADQVRSIRNGIRQSVRGADNLSDAHVDDLIAKAISPNSARKTVLGHYPAYTELAEQLGARRFNIPTSVWNKMTDAEKWAANTKFLDRMIARGDDVILATRADLAKPRSYFARELEYLLSKGYKISEDGFRLIAPGAH